MLEKKVSLTSAVNHQTIWCMIVFFIKTCVGGKLKRKENQSLSAAPRLKRPKLAYTWKYDSEVVHQQRQRRLQIDTWTDCLAHYPGHSCATDLFQSKHHFFIPPFANFVG